MLPVWCESTITVGTFSLSLDFVHIGCVGLGCTRYLQIILGFERELCG